MELVQQNWHWISTNPWGAAGLALLCITFGWAAASLFYQERIEVLKERQSVPKKQTSSSPQFVYPTVGRHGKNVLANSTKDVFVGDWLSFRAEIPSKSRLHIELQGPEFEDLDDTGASWMYSISTINWTTSKYDAQNGGRQFFDAEEGTADLKLQFARAGEVRITALEGASQTPSWTKVLRVRPMPENASS
jgi:hypothetical protein